MKRMSYLCILNGRKEITRKMHLNKFGGDIFDGKGKKIRRKDGECNHEQIRKNVYIG